MPIDKSKKVIVKHFLEEEVSKATIHRVRELFANNLSP